jgi:hypothetical protein
MHRSKQYPLLDHFVGASEQRRRHVKAEQFARAIGSIDLVADPFASGHVRGSEHPGCGK